MQATKKPDRKSDRVFCCLKGAGRVASPWAAGLLGGGSSASGSGGSSVGSGLGGVSSSVGSGGGSSRGSLSGGRSSFSGGCGSRSRGFHRSGCRCGSGLFLLATSGECSGSNQGCQNEGVLHFSFLVGQTEFSICHNGPSLGTQSLWQSRYQRELDSARNYMKISSILTNTDARAASGNAKFCKGHAPEPDPQALKGPAWWQETLGCCGAAAIR